MIRIGKPTSTSLVEAIRAGGRREEQAVAFLIRHNAGKIRQVVLRNNGNEADVDDVFQEGLTALVLNIRKGTFRGESSINTYLYAICKGIWYKRLRKLKRITLEEDPADGLETDPVTPEIDFLDGERKRLLMELFGHLREKCSEVLFLWAQSYSMEEIAAKLDYGSAQVAMNKKNKCLKELHHRIEDDPIIQQLLKEL